MNVEMESNRSVKRIAIIDGNKLSFKAPSTSSLKKTLLKSGKLKRFGGATTNPRAHANSVTIQSWREKRMDTFARSKKMKCRRRGSSAGRGFQLIRFLTR